MRALVVTVVHNPQDSRIRHREIGALLDAGWMVTYAAPFEGYGLAVDDATPEALHLINLPRAFGRRRLAALRAARKLLKEQGAHHDLVLLHDPELLAALPGLGLRNVVWDVHEDTAAAVTLKPWLPRPLRPVVRWIFQRVERFTEGKVHLILAEHAYQARFYNRHQVVPNVTAVPKQVPPPEAPRVVYAGSMTRARGVMEMIAVGRVVTAKTGGELRVELMGIGTAEINHILRKATEDGAVDWAGFVPNDEAKRRIEGSIAGLSLLHDEPNYRVSLPSKVTDYIAHGVPVVTTPLPLASEVVDDARCGVVVPFEDPEAAAQAVLDLWEDPQLRREMGIRGHQVALEKYDWALHGTAFVAEMEEIAGKPAR